MWVCVLRFWWANPHEPKKNNNLFRWAIFPYAKNHQRGQISFFLFWRMRFLGSYSRNAFYVLQLNQYKTSTYLWKKSIAEYSFVLIILSMNMGTCMYIIYLHRRNTCECRCGKDLPVSKWLKTLGSTGLSDPLLGWTPRGWCHAHANRNLGECWKSTACMNSSLVWSLNARTNVFLLALN